jgi:hypothetical protein
MAIYEVFNDNILQRCEKCGTVNLVAFDRLKVGAEREGRTDERVVPLPACSSCGSSEYLIRTGKDEPEHPVPGSFGHLHRLLVDHVHAELVRQGRIAPSLQSRPADSLISKTLEGSVLQRWFPSGLKLVLDEGEREAPTQGRP